jgi:hypothetical protein
VLVWRQRLEEKFSASAGDRIPDVLINKFYVGKEMEGSDRDLIYCPCIYLEKQMKTTNKFRYNSWSWAEI